MPRTYLDTNVYGNTGADRVDALRAAMARAGIVPRLGLADVDELPGDWETNRWAVLTENPMTRSLFALRRGAGAAAGDGWRTENRRSVTWAFMRPMLSERHQ